MLPVALRKLYAVVVSVGLCLAVLHPIRRHLPIEGAKQVRDSFPLSHFSMFSKARPDTEPGTYMLALEADGTRHFVHHSHWSTGGWNTGRAQLHRHKRGKAGGPEALCERVATSLGEVQEGWPTRVVEVQMAWGRYDPERWFREGHKEPTVEKTLTSCTVPR